MISFTCSCCGRNLTVPDDGPSKEFPCPDCGLLTPLASPAMTDNESLGATFAVQAADSAAVTQGREERVCTDSPDAAVPPEFPFIPGYEILGELGRGGMGVVYRRQTALNRTVALKMILAGAHAGRRNWRASAPRPEAVARLQHPNIVQIYEVGEHDGRPYLLAGVRRRRQPGRQAGRHAAAARRKRPSWCERWPGPCTPPIRQGVVHRDLKPANVLLTARRHAQDHRLRPGQAAGR